MIIPNISESIAVLLNEASEIWVAMALISDEGFQYLQEHLNKDAIQHLLVGINLPTPVSVLESMLSALEPPKFDARICFPEDGIFHPKLYLIRINQSYTAILGSGNLTRGGLEANIELGIKVTDQEQCQFLLSWFIGFYKDAYPITPENIEAYRPQFERSSDLSKKAKFNGRIKLKKNFPGITSLENIDFSDRYFKKEHHLAFRPELHKNTSALANNERGNTADRFL